MPNEETTAFPEWVVPMAATLTQERFTGPEWIFERKLDGIRMLAFKNGTDVKLYSRNRLLQHYPAVAEAITNLPVPRCNPRRRGRVGSGQQNRLSRIRHPMVRRPFGDAVAA